MPTFIKVVDSIYVNPDHIVTIGNNYITLVNSKTIYLDMTADQILEILKNGK